MANYYNEDLERLFYMSGQQDEDGENVNPILNLAKEKNIDLNAPIIPVYHQDIRSFFKSNFCTVIHVCAYFNKPVTLEELNKNGVQINIPDDAGNYPIHYACDTKIAKKLQSLGADVNATNRNEEIPAMTFLRRYIEAFKLYRTDEIINFAIQELEEWTKMGALLDTTNKFGQNTFDIFPKNLQQHAEQIQSFYQDFRKNQNFPQNQYSISANGEVTTFRAHHGGSGTETRDLPVIWMRNNERP